jgi:glycosyltransferase involved in cell wall biosynthesis
MINPATAAMRVVAVIPALNESTSIVEVVRAVAQYLPAIVVDDGSTDATGSLARGAGAIVVHHDSNQGYDRALESGLYRAVELDYDAVITLDADGQHAPALLLRFTDALAGGADLVVGVRDHRQRWSESLFRVISRILWRIEDPLCGMKAYTITFLRRAVPLRTYESIGTELALLASRSDCKIAEVAVPCALREGHSRFGSGLRANLRIVRALLHGLVDRRVAGTAGSAHDSVSPR